MSAPRTATDFAREGARQGDGKFGSHHLPASTVPPPPPVMSQAADDDAGDREAAILLSAIREVRTPGEQRGAGVRPMQDAAGLGAAGQLRKGVPMTGMADATDIDQRRANLLLTIEGSLGAED